jgi:hypothetical protein
MILTFFFIASAARKQTRSLVPGLFFRLVKYLLVRLEPTQFEQLSILNKIVEFFILLASVVTISGLFTSSLVHKNITRLLVPCMFFRLVYYLRVRWELTLQC